MKLKLKVRWNCWNSLAVMFELRCSKFELFCSESADNFCAACGRCHSPRRTTKRGQFANRRKSCATKWSPARRARIDDLMERVYIGIDYMVTEQTKRASGKDSCWIVTLVS